MAGVGVGDLGSGRRKSLDAEINLVPFIDLLSMCISFLLLTAVWINIGAVQIKQSHGTDAAPTHRQQFEMSVRFISANALQVELRKGTSVKKREIRASDPPALLAQLESELKGWPETRDASMISAVKFSPRSIISYGDLVGVMDVFRKHQIVNLAVLPGGES